MARGGYRPTGMHNRRSNATANREALLRPRRCLVRPQAAHATATSATQWAEISPNTSGTAQAPLGACAGKSRIGTIIKAERLHTYMRAM